MANMAIPIDDELSKDIESHPWIVSSEFGKEALIKKEIFERYLKTGEVTDEDWEFCEKNDWHPVDELPLKKEFVEKMKQVDKETPVVFKSVADIVSRPR